MITLDSNDENLSNNQRLWEVFQDLPALCAVRLECSEANQFIRILQNIAPTLMDIELKRLTLARTNTGVSAVDTYVDTDQGVYGFCAMHWPVARRQDLY